MGTRRAREESKTSTETPDHSTARLSELATRVCLADDRVALNEFHGRKVFTSAGGAGMCLAEFIEAWRRQTLECMGSRGHGGEVIDRAAELLVDRWSLLPNFEETPADGESTTRLVSGGLVPSRRRETDCRKAFGAFTKLVREDFSANSPSSEVETEGREALLLRRLVLHQLGYCVKEARRERNSLTSRYDWPVNGSKVTLRFPRDFRGRRRREWLETHVGSFDLSNPAEAARIQAAIDAWFGKPAFVPLPEDLAADVPASWEGVEEEASENSGAGGLSVESFIADEKAAQIDGLPPSVQALGSAGVRDLVFAVLRNRVTGEFTAAKLAARHGLSESSFSRLAGREWEKRSGACTRIPILYVNIAQVVARVPWLRQAAESIGLWKRILEVAEGPGRHSEGSVHGS